MCYKIQKNIFWVHIRVLWSSFPLQWKPNILLVNYDSWWHHQMSVRELRRDRQSGWFSKSRGLCSPPPPRSFTYAIFARSLTIVPRSLLLNRTETLATQATATVIWGVRVWRKIDGIERKNGAWLFIYTGSCPGTKNCISNWGETTKTITIKCTITSSTIQVIYAFSMYRLILI